MLTNADDIERLSFLTGVGTFPPFAIQSILNNLKCVLAKTANGASPVIGDIFPLGAGSNSAIGVALRRVVNIAAGANVLFHCHILLKLLEVTVEESLKCLAVTSLVLSTLLLFYASGNVQKPLKPLFKPHL